MIKPCKIEETTKAVKFITSLLWEYKQNIENIYKIINFSIYIDVYICSEEVRGDGETTVCVYIIICLHLYPHIALLEKQDSLTTKTQKLKSYTMKM